MNGRGRGIACLGLAAAGLVTVGASAVSGQSELTRACADAAAPAECRLVAQAAEIALPRLGMVASAGNPVQGSASTLAGTVGGVLLADRIVRGREFSASHGLLTDLGTVAGGLLGLGAAALISSDDADEDLLLTLGGIGASLGFGLTVASLAPAARQRERRQLEVDRREGRLDLQLNPAALAAIGLDRGRSGSAPVPAMPLLMARYSF